jgi:hypothetical protein
MRTGDIPKKIVLCVAGKYIKKYAIKKHGG